MDFDGGLVIKLVPRIILQGECPVPTSSINSRGKENLVLESHWLSQLILDLVFQKSCSSYSIGSYSETKSNSRLWRKMLVG